ncbi:acyltransferase [Arthrobacter sp. zg-Y324]|nr:acyltransferase [Arthrobacter caoxuetaonis]
MPPLSLSAPAFGPARGSRPTRFPADTLPARHRPDIQGLRALAVGIVVWYHIWPQTLPGGFVGVDVFFVISGYLIVGSLAREAMSTGSLKLAKFYSRRIKRLLPAAATVLLATLAATVLVFPQGRWQSVARDVAASGLNIQNWNQAFSTTSYEGATASVSPLQHFWSLAVEEQFYLVVPLLILICAAASGGRRPRRSLLISALTAVALASFAHSVIFSASNPDLAYFFSTTRIWELALGGMLAVAFPQLRSRPHLSLLLGWLGLAMVLASAVLFSTAMDFPGYAALLPVLGTMALLLAGSTIQEPGFGSAARWQALRPVTYLGDISYSLYLWHWPVIVFSVYVLGPNPGWLHGGAVVVLSVALAALSTRFVEEPFRKLEPKPRRGGRRRAAAPAYRPVFTLGAILTLVPIAAATAPYLVVEQKTRALSQELDLAAYPGAGAVHATAPVPDMPVRPDPAVAGSDQPDGVEACLTAWDPRTMELEDCVAGDTGSSRSIVLVGDSHAAQYMGSVDLLARESGYRLYVLARNGCPFSLEPLHSGTVIHRTCAGINTQTVQEIIDLGPSFVLTASLSPAGYEDALDWGWDSQEQAKLGYANALAPLRDAGLSVAVLSDVPYPPFNVPECVSGSADPADCSFPASGEAPPLTLAAQELDGVTLVDFRGYFCPDGQCQAVLGNVLVYRDNHITDSFAKTLALPLRDSLGI